MVKMPWYQKYLYIFMNYFVKWPTSSSIRKQIISIEKEKSIENVSKPGRDETIDYSIKGFCCVLHWGEIYNRADEPHTVSDEDACIRLVGMNPGSDYLRNLPPGPCERKL